LRISDGPRPGAPALRGSLAYTLSVASPCAFRTAGRILFALGLLCGTGPVLAQQAHTLAPDREFVGELERFGEGGREYIVFGLPARGFEQLSLQRKLLAYYLYRAAIAGNDIATHQSHRYAFEIKDTLEQAYLFSEGLPWPLRGALLDYLKQIWVNHGHYRASDQLKIVPESFTPEMLRQSVLHAASRGGRFETRTGESLEQKLQRLEPHIFEAGLEPLRTDTGASEDVLATSFVNLYHPAITSEILAGASEGWKSGTNVFFDFRNGTVVPLAYKVGGLLGEYLRTVSFWLDRAMSVAESEAQEESLRSLLGFYSSGEERMFRDHSREWLKSRSLVDYVNGFVDPGLDPRGVVGQFGAGAFLRMDSAMLHRLAMNAGYFEQRMPWPNRYKRQRARAPAVQLAQILVGTGALGPQGPATHDFPLHGDIRRDFGSKGLILSNIQEAQSDRLDEEIIAHFHLPRYRSLQQSFGTPARRWHEYLREVIGRNSGRAEPELRQDPRLLLGAAYGPIEEARVNLVALHLVFDRRLVELGAIPRGRQRQAAEAMYISFLQDHLAGYRSLSGPRFQDAQGRGAELILRYLAEGGPEGGRDYGVRVADAFGNYYVEVTDLGRARRGVRELLARLQIIKSTADLPAANELLERFAGEVNPAWRANIRQRAARLGIPRRRAYVFPQLVPVMVDKEIVDVRVEHFEDLMTQQLRFSRWRFDTGLVPD
jgi:dipeptidyl-peptidase III